MFEIFLTVVKETTLSLIGKITWKIIFERFYTRLFIYSLNKIKNMSTNDVIDNTVQDIINELKGKKLSIIDKGI